MKTTRRLALRRERLTELTTDELAAVAGAGITGQTQPTVSGVQCVARGLPTLHGACLTGTETYTCLCTTGS